MNERGGAGANVGFEAWCEDVSRRVVEAEPELEDARAADRGDSYSWQGRFIVITAMGEECALVGGLATSGAPVLPGQPLPRGEQLFRGGARQVRTDAAGAALTARAIVAWLLGRDDDLPQIRHEFGAG